MPKDLYQSQLGLPSIKGGKFRSYRWWKLGKALCRISVLVATMFSTMATTSVAVDNYENSTDLWKDIYVNITAKKLVQNEKENMSSTPRCVITAATLRNNMDENVDPCEDFYQFSCGGWIDKHIIPEDKGHLSVYSSLDHELFSKLKVLVEKPLQDSAPDYMKKLKIIYDSCMAITEIENVEEEPLKDILKSMGGWPVVEGASWNESDFDWIDTLIEFRKRGFSHDVMLKVSIKGNYSFIHQNSSSNYSSKYMIVLDETLLGLPNRYDYFRGHEDPIVKIYFGVMLYSAEYLGASRPAALGQLTQSLDFEKDIVDLSFTQGRYRAVRPVDKEMTVKDLELLAPQINWTKYLNGLLLDNIPEDEMILVLAPDFIKQFALLIESTDKRVIANYMIWRLVQQSMPFLNNKWRRLVKTYSNLLSREREQTRWKECLTFLKENVPVSLASLYVRHHFTKDTKKEILEMAKYIHTEFLKMLDEATWMNEGTRRELSDKANSIEIYIGYREELLNDTKVSIVYENLTGLTNSFFENVLKIEKWTQDSMFARLRKKNEKREWIKYTEMDIVGAHYLPFDNSVWLPAGMLQEAYFDKERPRYMNYGGIGSVIGHEITHGFDNKWHQLDKDGNKINWRRNDQVRLNERFNCLADKYSNYTIPEIGMQINGKKALQNNIADNGGVKEAFRAYKQWVEDNGPEPRLPGLKYTPEQLFWISFANMMCAKFYPEALREQMRSREPTPDRFRVIGTLSNSPDFARAFNCPEGSPMNPNHKCTVW